jgi:hypothetical protein
MPPRRIGTAFGLATLALGSWTMPALAAVVRVPAPEGIPAWAVAILAVIGILIAIGILWLPERIARRVKSPRLSGIVMLGGIVLLTVCFVLGVRALVVALGGT